MDEEFLVSVVISTFNRSAMLQSSLVSIAASRMRDRSEVEVLVVDNNSTDETEATVRALQLNYPFRLAYLMERKQGLSHARNRGVEAASGKYLVFMDDDEQIAPDYLSRVRPIFETTDAACVGGPMILAETGGAPEWLSTLGKVHGQRYLGDEPRVLGPESKPLWGGNMAFVCADLRDAGPFDARLGRCGGRQLQGEDYDMQLRFHRKGKKVVYHPGLVQYHHFLLPTHYSKNYWRTRYFRAGQSRYLMDGEKWGHARRFFRAPRTLWRRLIFTDVPGYFASFCTLTFSNIFRHELFIWRQLGRIYQARKGQEQ